MKHVLITEIRVAAIKGSTADDALRDAMTLAVRRRCDVRLEWNTHEYTIRYDSIIGGMEHREKP